MNQHERVASTSAPADVGAILAAAAGAARYAPSIHNTQPWRWRTLDSAIELSAEWDRRLPAGDPSGRMLTISCGASLAYATAAVAAQGRRPIVSRFPHSDALATVEVGEVLSDHTAESELFRALMLRQTDRRPLREPAPTPEQIDAIRRGAEQHGAHIHLLRRDQVIRLATAADTARRLESADTARKRELDEWVAVGEDAPGVPDSTIPAPGGHYLVPPRFQAGRLPIDHSGGDAAAAYLMLVTDEDDQHAWLRGGEALVYAWAAAIQAGLVVMPLSSVVEIAETRLGLYRILSDIGHPLLIMRVGHPDPTAEPPMTPRYHVPMPS
ncbi:hypothetical protein FB566_5047 [Stackebrandtia endophytica]|uniref:Nitroreductase family protein n=1 Tax=Stackebrandtia endophytica TaxID=1496996 RepID=A0A543B3N5_9ACTN|nr:nitroreductase [Stackebrandtia endophytica]TQL79441.1 hypothetical protein FB566_5047 [Stackebrandtia endophytica]